MAYERRGSPTYDDYEGGRHVIITNKLFIFVSLLFLTCHYADRRAETILIRKTR